MTLEQRMTALEGKVAELTTPAYAGEGIPPFATWQDVARFADERSDDQESLSADLFSLTVDVLGEEAAWRRTAARMGLSTAATDAFAKAAS